MVEAAGQYEQRKLIHDCFNGNIERNCSKCPAHHTRQGGLCCFGDPDQYDGDSEDCQKCDFEEACTQEVIEHEAEAQYAAKNYGWRPPTRTSTSYSRFGAPAKERLVQIGGLRRGQEQEQSKEEVKRRPSVITPPRKMPEAEIERGHESLWIRFWKDSVWGMGQGFFEMAAEFFRTHRLP